MKIIDDKGRFLGIINFLDMTVLLTIILLIGSIFYTYPNRINSKYIEHPSKNQEIFVTLFITGIRDISVRAVNEGDLFRDSETKATLGRVIDKTVSNAQMVTTNEAGDVIYTFIPERYDMKITLECRGTISEDNVKISNEPIHIGESIILESKILKTNGVVFGIEY